MPPLCSEKNTTSISYFVFQLFQIQHMNELDHERNFDGKKPASYNSFNEVSSCERICFK